MLERLTDSELSELRKRVAYQIDCTAENHETWIGGQIWQKTLATIDYLAEELRRERLPANTPRQAAMKAWLHLFTPSDDGLGCAALIGRGKVRCGYPQEEFCHTIPQETVLV